MKVYPTFYKAIGLLALVLVVIVFVIPTILSALNSTESESSPSLSSYSGLQDVEAFVDDQLAPYQGKAPEWFNKEVVDLSSYESVLLSNDGRLVSFNSAQDVPTLACQLKEELKRHGWTTVESGVDECWTCIKEEGTVTWGIIQIAQTPLGSSVVISAH